MVALIVLYSKILLNIVKIFLAISELVASLVNWLYNKAIPINFTIELENRTTN